MIGSLKMDQPDADKGSSETSKKAISTGSVSNAAALNTQFESSNFDQDNVGLKGRTGVFSTIGKSIFTWCTARFR